MEGRAFVFVPQDPFLKFLEEWERAARGCVSLEAILRSEPELRFDGPADENDVLVGEVMLNELALAKDRRFFDPMEEFMAFTLDADEFPDGFIFVISADDGPFDIGLEHALARRFEAGSLHDPMSQLEYPDIREMVVRHEDPVCGPVVFLDDRPKTAFGTPPRILGPRAPQTKTKPGVRRC